MATPANDAQLAQDVRSRLGRERSAGDERVNVSSCSFVVTLHGMVGNPEEVERISALARSVPGVADIENKLVIR